MDKFIKLMAQSNYMKAKQYLVVVDKVAYRRAKSLATRSGGSIKSVVSESIVQRYNRIMQRAEKRANK